eukprot:2494883-Alexandrium_andersonii.AAC.1
MSECLHPEKLCSWVCTRDLAHAIVLAPPSVLAFAPMRVLGLALVPPLTLTLARVIALAFGACSCAGTCG